MKCTIATVFLLLLFAGSVFAESAGSLVESGNEAFRQGDYAASLKNYDKAAEAEPDSAIILFNKGDALYRQEKFADAFNVFEQAAGKAREDNDQRLEALSLYNMGNSSFAKAENLQQEYPETALPEYKRSGKYYESAVKLAPNMSEAAHNLEVSRIAAKKVEELIRKRQEQAREHKRQKEELTRELEDLQQEQQKAAEQSKDLSRSRSAGNDQKGGVQQAGQQAEKQQSITDRTRQAGEKLARLNQEQRSGPVNEMAGDHVRKAVVAQEAAEENLQQNKPAAAHERQEEAAKELQNARQRLQENQGSGGKKKSPASKDSDRNAEAGQQKKQGQQDAGAETGQHVQESPQVSGASVGESPEEIINEELLNRKSRRAKAATGYKPVDKDW